MARASTSEGSPAASSAVRSPATASCAPRASRSTAPTRSSIGSDRSRARAAASASGALLHWSVVERQRSAHQPGAPRDRRRALLHHSIEQLSHRRATRRRSIARARPDARPARAAPRSGIAEGSSASPEDGRESAESLSIDAGTRQVGELAGDDLRFLEAGAISQEIDQRRRVVRAQRALDCHPRPPMARVTSQDAVERRATLRVLETAHRERRLEADPRRGVVGQRDHPVAQPARAGQVALGDLQRVLAHSGIAVRERGNDHLVVDGAEALERPQSVQSGQQHRERRRAPSRAGSPGSLHRAERPLARTAAVAPCRGASETGYRAPPPTDRTEAPPAPAAAAARPRRGTMR